MPEGSLRRAVVSGTRNRSQTSLGAHRKNGSLFVCPLRFQRACRGRFRNRSLKGAAAAEVHRAACAIEGTARLRPLALKPGLSSSQFAQAACKHTLPISFGPNWQCTRLAKGCSSSVVVRVRTTKEQQVAHAGSLR